MDVKNNGRKNETSLEQEFVDSTTLHGIAHIASNSRPVWIRVVWALAFGACLGVCCWQTYLRIGAYLSYEINTKVSRVYRNDLEFPAVTICNFNRYRSSLLTLDDLAVVAFVLYAVDYEYDSYFTEDSLYDYDQLFGDLESTFNYTEFTLRAGFVLDEYTLVECKWRGRDCSAKDFTHVFTSYGNCYTFNSGDKPVLKEDQPGSGNGLKMTINIQQEEYSETLTGNIQAGLKMLVHDQADPPLMDTLGLAIPPGNHAFIAVRKEEFENLEEPWSGCDKSRTLQYHDDYTRSGCFLECQLDHIVRKCGCRPVRYPGDARVCSPRESSTCVKDVLRMLKNGSLGQCDCIVPCSYSQFTSFLSYGSIPSLSVANEINNEMEVDYQRRNYVVLDIYYEDLSYQLYEEQKALSLSGLISDIGGNIGLFLGGSLLFFAELIDYVLMKIDGACRPQRKRDMKTGFGSYSVNTLNCAYDHGNSANNISRTYDHNERMYARHNPIYLPRL